MTASALASFTLDSIGPLARSVADCEPVSVAGLRFGLAEGLPLGGLGDTVDGRGQCQGRHRAVRVRIERGCAVAAADYIETVRAHERLVRALDRRLAATDALVMPTTAIVAPEIAEVADPRAFAARNFMLLRNTAIGNFFDLCAMSLPLPVALPVGLMLLARNGKDRTLLRIAATMEKLFGRWLTVGKRAPLNGSPSRLGHAATLVLTALLSRSTVSMLTPGSKAARSRHFRAL